MMLEKARFIIYMIYNFSYKDGNHRKNEPPKFNTVFLLVLFESYFLGLGIVLYDAILYFVNGPLNGIWVPSSTFIVWIGMFATNYYYFITKGKLDELYKRYANNYKERESKYKKWLIGLYIALPIVCIAIGGNAKAWFTLGE